MKKSVIILIGIILIMMISGCTLISEVKDESKEVAEAVGEFPRVEENWMDIELIDIKTGTKLKISNFKGKQVLLESFAVWCPACTKQQQETQKLHNELGDSFVSISFDTDPNEDEKNVLGHIERNGFDWYYAISPRELTRALMDEFGAVIANVVDAPIILICENQSSRLLSRGIKSADKLKAELELGCEKEPEVEKAEKIVEVEEVKEEVQKKENRLVNGKTLEERLKEAYDDLHGFNSALRIKENFPDLELVYTDQGQPFMPQEILPFRYYYSEEADRTFNLCEVDRSVFICKGKLDRLISDEDINSGRCVVTPIYQLTPGQRGSSR